ncbi:MAG: hypothetical protein CVT60_02310 [Actinobacteria bacterium HGW-Actinobacteria-10]|jgi:hypothetical protein|nr:MAG: hypothetical protein CVT60_02310 [Actinobacteria bacterium HGW-Actinobacteria-10]
MDYTEENSPTTPTQFRLPRWAREFLVEESAARGTTRTDVVLEALGEYREKRLHERLAEGYSACADTALAEVNDWDATLADGLEREW